MPTRTEPEKLGTKLSHIPSQQVIYSKIACEADAIINRLFDLMDSRNEAISLGAAKILANKIIPDKKAIELMGEDGEPIKFNLITGADFSRYVTSPTTSDQGFVTGTTPIQGAGVAQESAQDNNGNQSDSEVGDQS